MTLQLEQPLTFTSRGRCAHAQNTADKYLSQAAAFEKSESTFTIYTSYVYLVKGFRATRFGQTTYRLRRTLPGYETRGFEASVLLSGVANRRS